MNRMIPLVIQYLVCVFLMVKIWRFSSKFDQSLSLYLWFSNTEIQDRTRVMVLVRVSWVTISRIYWQFWHSFFKYTFESSFNIYPIEITWRKMVRTICLKPVSMATWHLHTLLHFIVPLPYYTIQNMSFTFIFTRVNLFDTGMTFLHYEQLLLLHFFITVAI